MKKVCIGCMVAMVAHAAALSSRGTTPSTYVVVLEAKTEQELLDLEQDLIRSKVPHAAFREPDLGNALMAIGIEPTDRKLLRRYLKNFSLVGA